MSEKRVGFYTRVIALDVLREQHDPTPETTEVLAQALKDESYCRYFFMGLDNPAWLPALKATGLFDEPPEPIETEDGLYRIPRWEASEYLVRVANAHPDLVVEITLQIETENYHVHHDLLQAAMAMPPDIAAKMVPAVAGWLGGRFSDSVPEYAGDLMVYLAEGDQWEAAFELLDLLTEPVVRQVPEIEDETVSLSRSSEAHPRFDRYIYEKLLKEHMPQLAGGRPFAVIEVLEKQLVQAIDYDKQVALWIREGDGSVLWRSAIEDHPQNSTVRGIKELLTEAIRDVLQGVATEDRARAILERYSDHQYSIFRRLAIHIVRLYPDLYRDLLIRLFDDRDNLDDPNIHHEFMVLLGEAFDKAPTEVQQRLLDWILEGQPTERIEQSRQRYRRDHGVEPPEDLLRKWNGHWILRRLWTLRNHALPTEYRSRLDALVAELGEPEHPSFLSYGTTVSWVGDMSPKSKDELAAMTPGEVLEYLKQYVPPQDPLAPSLEGLLNVFQAVVQERAEEYAVLAPDFLESDVRPVHIYRLLWGLEQALKAGKNFDWDPVLTLCEEVIQRTDEQRTSFETSYEAVHGQVATLLQEAARRDDHPIPQEHMSRVRGILLRLVYHSDPTPEYEDVQLASQDPATISLNTVRGKAMHALIGYALQRARFINAQTQGEEGSVSAQRLEPEVRELLTEKLDKTKDPSLAIHSVFGLYLHNLYYLDQEWLLQHVSQIFAAEVNKQAYWWAAWNSYIAFNPFRKDLYLLLRDEYRRAVEQFPGASEYRVGFERAGEHLAGHLMIAYWHGLEELEGDDVLLPAFFEKAPDNIRAHAVWFLWRGLEEVKPSTESEIWQRMRRLWEARVDAAAQTEDPSVFSQEISTFAHWLNVAPEDLESLYVLVWAVIPYLERGAYTSEVMEYLAAQAKGYPDLAARLLLEIIEQEKLPLHRGRPETRVILEAAMRSEDEGARSHAEVAINLLGERGLYEYRDLLELTPGAG